MDLERVMSIFATHAVSFDIEPPLRHVGADQAEELGESLFDVRVSLGYERFATSRSPSAITWHSATASIGSAAR